MRGASVAFVSSFNEPRVVMRMLNLNQTLPFDRFQSKQGGS
jgi:hypothetical protein